MAFRFCFCLTVLLGTSFLHIASAQKLSFGFTAGPSFSTLNFSDPPMIPDKLDLDPYDYKTGFLVGVNGSIQLNANTALRLEANFERQGGTSGLPLSNGTGQVVEGLKVRDHFDYLQVPLLLQLSAGNSTMFLAHFGFSVGYLVHHTSKFPATVNINREPPQSDYTLKMPSDYKKINTALVGGVGASMPLSEWINLQLMVRANAGLGNLNKDELGFEVKTLSIVPIATVQFNLY